jgi:hypothetical protein
LLFLLLLLLVLNDFQLISLWKYFIFSRTGWPNGHIPELFIVTQSWLQII